MIKNNLIVYSRTLANDYRWIYDCPIPKEIKSNILNDFEKLKNNNELSLEDNCLFVKYIENGICFYKIFKTDFQDQYSRNIFALSGFVFTSFNFDVLKHFAPIIAAYYYYRNDIFKVNLNNVSDNIEKETLICEIDLNNIADYFISNKHTNEKVNNISNFINQYPNIDFMLKPNGVCSNVQLSNKNKKNTTTESSSKENQNEIKNENKTEKDNSDNLLSCLKKYISELLTNI